MTKPKKIRDINAERDAILGNQINHYYLKMPAFQPPPNLEALRRAYLAHLEHTYHALDFKGIPQLKNFAQELALEDVYVPLVARPEMPKGGDTWERRLAGRDFGVDALPDGMHTPREEAAPPVPVEEAMRERARVIVLGDPGSGKSTLLKHLALGLAAEKEAPLPILIPLNAYARALQNGENLNLQAFFSTFFAGYTKALSGLQPLFDEAIQNGQAVILLDGLDEVQANRAHLVHKVEAFAADAEARGNKLVVTSRIVGYKEAPLASKHWNLYTLLDFGPEAIARFAEKWCLAFEIGTHGDTTEARAAAAQEQRELLEAIEGKESLQRLASNPLLLTILALIKRQNVKLPNSRVKLYDIYLETLIDTWNKARSLDKGQVGPDTSYSQILEPLAALALWLREKNPTAGVVAERDLLAELARYYRDEESRSPGEAKDRARGFLEGVQRYSNLLVERGARQYGFLHLTFEEMLAAYGLYQQGQLDLKTSLDVIRAHLTDPGWRETILLAVGVWGLANNQRRVAGKVVQEILAMPCPTEHDGQNILLAGACLEDVGEEGVDRATAERVQTALLNAAHERALPPAVQRDAGFSLARTGWIPADLDKFIRIEAGEFRYGGDDFKERTEIIKHPFEIAKYPVTNLQYRRFIEADGYDQQKFWSADGWAWRTGAYDSQAPDEYKNWLSNRPPEKRSEPYWWHDRKWNNPLAPVVGVCWFEAQACANWLAQELGKPVRLPTEEEWERTARGINGREYSWGNKFNHEKANCSEFWAKKEDLSDYNEWKKWRDSDKFKLASTSLIGQFCEGDTPEGISDLSGNVWEWTNSWYSETERTLRGGAWSSYRWSVRCASRVGLVPDYFLNYVGFRLVSPG